MQALVKILFTVVHVAAQAICHAAWFVLATVLGDDFIASNETQSFDMLDKALEQAFVLKKMPREFGGTSEGQLTKSSVSWSLGGFYWKGDSPLGDKEVWYFYSDKREATRRLTTLGTSHEMQLISLLVRCNVHRSMVPTAHHEAVDRPDLQNTTSVLMRTQ